MPPYRRLQSHEKREKKLTYKEYCHKTHCNWPGGTPPTKDQIMEPILDTLPTYLMPSGKYQGQQIQNVPAKHLLWLFENNKCNDAVRNYVVRNEIELRRQFPYPIFRIQ